MSFLFQKSGISNLIFERRRIFSLGNLENVQGVQVITVSQ